MLEAAGNFVVAVMDYVLGWVLFLPRDLMLFAVAILTSGILVFVRLFSTDQGWLRRAAADRKRLRELIKAARRRGDREARKRHKAVLTLIKVKSLRFEGRPLLYAVVPIALLATWCFSRVAYHPPGPGETVEVRAYFPVSAIGRLAYLVPDPGLRAEGGWMQTVVRDRPLPVHGWWDAFNARTRAWLNMDPPLEGLATWRVRAEGRGQAHLLRLRYAGRTYEKAVLVGSRHYAPAVEIHSEGPVRAIELAMRPVKLFGLVGGIDALYLPPWLVAYLLIAIPCVGVLKRVLRIH